jgi:hypothetical protein
MSKKACTVCGHAQRVEIDRALMSGETQRSISAKYNLSSHTISRHVRHSREPEPENLSQQAALWSSRAEQLWASATYDADTKAQVAALSAGLKSLQAQQKEAERQVKQEPQASAKIDPSFIDKVIADCDQRQLELCLAESLRLKVPDLYTMFCQMQNRPAMQRAVISYANEWAENESGVRYER